MKGKNQKTQSCRHSFYDYDGIARHLEKMAQKGWMLEQIQDGRWKYHRIEPQKLKFAVTYFWEASDENMEHTENQETFLESCEQAGWKLCAEWMQMQIFCSEQENPIPIETDEATKLDNIHLCMSQKYLKTQLILVAVVVIYLLFIGKDLLENSLIVLANTYVQFLVIGIAAIVIFLLWELLAYWMWYRKSRDSINQGGPCAVLSPWHYRIRNGLLFLCGAAILLSIATMNLPSGRVYVMVRTGWILLAVFFIRAVQRWMKRKKVSQSMITVGMIISGVICFVVLLSWELSWEEGTIKEKLDPQPVGIYLDKDGLEWDVYDDAIPLRVEDMKETGETVYSYEWIRQEESILAKRYSAVQNDLEAISNPKLYYQIVEVRVPLLYDLCLNGLQTDDWWNDDEKFFPIEDERWKADRVYRKYEIDRPEETPLNEYLLCWDRFLVRIVLDWEPDGEDIQVIREKLSAPVLERKLEK